jgi:release factor glutamine methyltransferase
VDDPRLCAEVLLAHVLGCPRIQLYAQFSLEPPAEKLTAYRELVKRAASHEPVAYLVGAKEFYSLKFKVTPDVLIPRPETEILVSEAIHHLRGLGRPGKVWDACTGSGCVALAVAANVKDAAVLATDLCPRALAVAAENAASLGVSDRVRLREADLLNLPADCADLSPLDVITANPPYVAKGDPVGATVRHEPALALYAGEKGLEFLRRIIAAAPGLLGGGGMLAMEFGLGHADSVRDLLVATGAFAEPKILRDHQSIERAAVARRL